MGQETGTPFGAVAVVQPARQGKGKPPDAVSTHLTGFAKEAAPAAVLTWLVSACGLGYAGGFLLSGPLSDLLGRRRVMTWGMAATAVTTALVALSPAPRGGARPSGCRRHHHRRLRPTAFSYIAERVEPRLRAVTMTSVVSALFASAVVAQLAAKALVDLLGWRPVFLLGGAAFAVVAVVLRRVMLPDTARRAGANPYAVVPALLRTPAWSWCTPPR
ncbi:MFS transporter [Microbispora rosea]|uniref:MFS transporter n=1 Tax=Microbispora rosea TaxID=58117 RepID=UPI0036AE369D